jgi:hypothetical protein
VNRLRIGFAVVGFVLAVISIAVDDHRLGWAAIAALLVSVLARLTLRKRTDSSSRQSDSDGSSSM